MALSRLLLPWESDIMAHPLNSAMKTVSTNRWQEVSWSLDCGLKGELVRCRKADPSHSGYLCSPFGDGEVSLKMSKAKERLQHVSV